MLTDSRAAAAASGQSARTTGHKPSASPVVRMAIPPSAPSPAAMPSFSKTRATCRATAAPVSTSATSGPATLWITGRSKG